MPEIVVGKTAGALVGIVKASRGLGRLTLRDNADNAVSLTADGTGFAQGFVFIDSTSAELGFGGGAVPDITLSATGIAIVSGNVGTHRMSLIDATGITIATSPTQKLGHFGAMPIVRPGATNDIKDSIVSLGLITGGGATPLDLDGGALTAGRAILSQADTPATPALAFGNGNTGFYERVDDDLRVSVSGTNTFLWFQTSYRSALGTGPSMQNRSASNVVPTFMPDNGDDDTGIGQAAADQLSLIAGGLEGIRITESGAAITAIDLKGDTFVAMGTSSSFSNVGGIANVNTTSVGNVGTGEDDLMTYTLPANSLNTDGKGIRITVWGSVAINGNTKTIRLKFGTTIIMAIGPSTMSGLDWKIEGLVIRTGAATQKAVATELLDTIAQDSTISSPTETLSSPVVIKVTGEGVADDDVKQEGMLIEHLN